jgi:hypothetical protein
MVKEWVVMSVRVFECNVCGHKMRLGAANCGYCRHTTPVMNRLPVIAALVVAIILVICLIALLAAA